MANIYEVRHSKGRTYDVPTDRHHDNHHDSDFKDHLLSILERTVGSLVSGYILHFTLKRRG